MKNREREGSRLRSIRAMFLGAVTATALILVPVGSASAVQTDIYDPFQNCPTDHPLLNDPDFMIHDGGCVAAIAKPGTTFRIGDNESETTKPSKTEWAFGSFDGTSLPVVPGSTTVTSSPEDAGSLLELPIEEVQPLVATLDPVLGVKTKVESAGDVSDWLLAPPTTRIKIKLINPVLGNNCYIGSNSDPIILRNTDWVAEDAGTLSFSSDPNGFEVFVIHNLNAVITNDAFAVPKARGCGPLGTLDPVINGQLGLPSPAGENATRVLSDTHIVGGPSGAEIQAAFDAAQ